MTKTIFASPARVAIYDGGRNAAVETSPLDHLDKIYFHSDLPYLGVVSTLEGTETIDTSGYSGSPARRTHVLAAHGLGYRPFALGQIWDNKPKYGTAGAVPFSGTVPWWGDRTTPQGGPEALQNIMHLHLTVDADHVMVYSRAAHTNFSPVAVAFYYRIHLFNRALPI